LDEVVKQLTHLGRLYDLFLDAALGSTSSRTQRKPDDCIGERFGAL
jgi:hypothetical protein